MHRPHCPIVVVGHTGHGKSVLVDAIAALQGDPARRAGTDVRVLRTATAAKRYTLLDVPGGQRSLPAMMRAVALADVVVLVVSSTMGPQALTREHLLAAQATRLSPLECGVVVVINDFGNGDHELLAACELEVRSLLVEHGEGGDDAPIVIGSLQNDPAGVAAAVLEALDRLPVSVRDDDDGDTVVRPLFAHPQLSAQARERDGAGNVVASARVIAGWLRLGDEVKVVGQRRVQGDWRGEHDPGRVLTARVTRVRLGDDDVDMVGPGEHVGLQCRFAGMLGTVDRFSSVIVSAQHPGPTSVMIARLTLRAVDVGGPRRGLRAGAQAMTWLGPSAVPGTILPIDDDDNGLTQVGPGSTFRAAVLLSTARFARIGDPIVVTMATGVLCHGAVTALVSDGYERTLWSERATAIGDAARRQRALARATP